MSEERNDVKAPFNMALNTLERLGEILSKIRQLSESPDISREVKQSMKTFLVIDFYIQAVPLLKEEDIKNNKNILDLKPKELGVIDEMGRRKDRIKEIFDWELEKKLNLHLISIQIALQKENYFMPPKQDLGKAVGFH